MKDYFQDEIVIPLYNFHVKGNLVIPDKAQGIIIFAHGSGSSRLSPRNIAVAQYLNRFHFATLLFDLLTEREDMEYANRFNINLLAERLVIATEWIKKQEPVSMLPVGYFGASTGAAAAINAAAQLLSTIGAVVSRGGRPDLAAVALEYVAAPTLLIVGSLDHEVITLNQQALEKIHAEKELRIVEGATHLFEEPGTMDEVMQLSVQWFQQHLSGAMSPSYSVDFRYADRLEAGQVLADELKKYKGESGVVLAIPRGGVPVGYVIAKELGFDFDLALSKKIGHPLQKEYAIGAVSLTDMFITDDDGVPKSYIREEEERIKAQLKEMYRKYMGDKVPEEIAGKNVIIVDDGIATGNTILSTINMVKEHSPKRIIVAVPVAPQKTIDYLSIVSDEIICPLTEEIFYGVGGYYIDFTQVTDDEVLLYTREFQDNQ